MAMAISMAMKFKNPLKTSIKFNGTFIAPYTVLPTLKTPNC